MPEHKYDKYIDKAIGPRVVGGVYRNGRNEPPYRVLDIKRDPENHSWAIKVEAVDPKHPGNGAWRHGPTWHSTAWDAKKGKVLKLPETMKPEQFVPSKEGKTELQDWIDFLGGKSAGKGRARIEGTEPAGESQVGFDSEGNAEEIPGLQRGDPLLHHYAMGDISEPGHPLADPGESFDFGSTTGLTDGQIHQLLEDIYGKKGAIRNKDNLDAHERAKPKINVSLGQMPRGPLINIPPPGEMPTGPKILTPGGLPGGMLAGKELADLLTGPKSPLINVPLSTRKRLLAQIARNQAKANGHHLIA